MSILSLVLDALAIVIFVLIPLTVVFADRGETPSIELLLALVGLGAAIAAGVVLLVSAPVFVVRYVLAARGRITLDKTDIYFIVAVILSVVTYLIGFVWRQ